jgi:hypothetical protein
VNKSQSFNGQLPTKSENDRFKSGMWVHAYNPRHYSCINEALSQKKKKEVSILLPFNSKALGYII